MAMITHAAPVARPGKARAVRLSHLAAYTVFAAAAGFMLAVVFGILP
jgi:hypothetical protein